MEEKMAYFPIQIAVLLDNKSLSFKLPSLTLRDIKANVLVPYKVVRNQSNST